jgi:hypothetical protein
MEEANEYWRDMYNEEHNTPHRVLFGWTNQGETYVTCSAHGRDEIAYKIVF